MRWFLGVIIILLSAHFAVAVSFSPKDIEWASGVTGTLNKGGTLTNGIYSVKAVQFPSPVPGIKDINGNVIPETEIDPSVLLEIYRNGTLIKEIIMNPQSEAYIDPDYEVKVSSTGFMDRHAREWIYEFYNPYASVSIQTRAYPQLDVSIKTDKSTYTSNLDQTITAKVTVTNSGGAFARNVDVNLDIGSLKLRGGSTSQLHQNYLRMEKGESQSFDVILEVPKLLDEKLYNLSADAKGYDVKGKDYNATTGLIVTVSPQQAYFTLSKSVRDRMYLQNTATVRVTFANGGTLDMYNIHINDSMNENFELKTNTSLHWDVESLKPGQEWGTTYSIKPLEAKLEGFTVPAAIANFTVNYKNYTVSSDTIKVVVNGPKILLNKTVNKSVVNISEDVTVNVSISDIGDIPTRVEVRDFLPEGVSLVGGPTSLESTFLELNAPQGFNYIIRMNTEGEIQLPAAVANYTGVEFRGTTRSVLSSQRPVITVINPNKTAPEPVAASNVTDNQTATVTESSAQKTASETTESISDISQNAPRATPGRTPITPGFNSIFAVFVLLLAAAFRRR